MQVNRQNKIALISGSSKRIGRHIALHLAKNGWKIILHCNHSHQEAENLKKEIDNITAAIIITFDLNNNNDYPLIFKEINNSIGKPNLLINNASSFERDNFLELDTKFFETQMKVNCLSHLLLSKVFFVNNEKDELNIVNINDYASQNINRSYFSYYMSKHVFLYASKIMAAELAPKCRVNTLSLGHVLKDKDRNQQIYKKMIQKTPLQKQVALEDIANAIDFILSSNSLTGTNIHIDCGISIKPINKL